MTFPVRDYFPGVSVAQTGYRCPKPYRYEFQAQMYQRDCGKCARCLAAKKRDIAARAAAEAVTSDEVVFLTATYRPGEDGAFKWIVKDRQDFLKRLRSRLVRDAIKAVGAPYRRRGAVREHWAPIIAAATKRVRYFGMGEVGEKSTKRNHWHFLLFLTGGDKAKPSFQSTPPNAKGDRNEIIDEWPHGHVRIDVLPKDESEVVKAIRYCVMYLHKAKEMGGAAGFQRAASVPFRSLKPAIGSAYLEDWGRYVAKAGLPLPSWFKVPGVSYSRGVRAGQAVKNYISGVARQTVIRAYREEWERLFPGRDLPDSQFRKMFDDDYCEPQRNPARRRPLGVRRAGREVQPLRPLPDGMAGWLLIRRDGQDIGIVRTLRAGVALWCPDAGGVKRLDETQDDFGFGVDQDTSRCIRQFLSARRAGVLKPGKRFSVSDYQSPEERAELAEANRVARWKAVLAASPPGVAIGPWGDPGPVPLTRLRRLLYLGGVVELDGTVKPRLPPETDWERRLQMDDSRKPDVVQVPVVNLLRVHNEERPFRQGSILAKLGPLGLPPFWEGQPKWMRSEP